MREVDTVVARGQGTWGKQYDLELSTHTTTRYDSTGGSSQVTTSYDVLVADPSVGRRRFWSEDERATFLEHSFTALVLKPVELPQEVELPHPLSDVVGSELAAATFVRDYLQLSFDSPPINLYVWPRIHSENRILTRNDSAYCDSLVDLIGVRLRAVDELLDLGLVLDFEGGARLAVPLDGTDLVGAEIAEYTNRTHDRGMIWRPGDEPVNWYAAGSG